AMRLGSVNCRRVSGWNSSDMAPLPTDPPLQTAARGQGATPRSRADAFKPTAGSADNPHGRCENARPPITRQKPGRSHAASVYRVEIPLEARPAHSGAGRAADAHEPAGHARHRPARARLRATH